MSFLYEQSETFLVINNFIKKNNLIENISRLLKLVLVENELVTTLYP